MARKTKTKTRKAQRPGAAKRQAKRSGRTALRKSGARSAAPSRSAPPPSLSRQVVEEVLVLSAKSSESEQLSDKAVAEIATCAHLDPEAVLDAHRRLCETADEPEIGFLRVIEISDPQE